MNKHWLENWFEILRLLPTNKQSLEKVSAFLFEPFDINGDSLSL